MPDRTPQHELNDFLQSELFHTLGSYGTTVERLRAQRKRIRRAGRLDEGAAPEALHVPESANALETRLPDEALARTLHLNLQLKTLFHRPAHLRDDGTDDAPPERHPAPLPMLEGDALPDGAIVDFYATAVEALRCSEASRELRESDAGRLGERLALIHDPQHKNGGEIVGPPRAYRRMRHERRLARAQQVTELTGTSGGAGAILAECLTTPGDRPLGRAVITALVEAHLCMHRAEHMLSASFGGKFAQPVDTDGRVRAQLERSLVLNTFVYVAGRTVPWIFAEDENERDYVQEEYEECCTTLSPTYCMWIGNQLGLLALHRRAYTHLLLGHPGTAYNDFHKLRRFTRNLERQLDARVSEAPGARAFLDGISAFADHHSGRIYRGQHAHTAAVRHFDRAAAWLTKLERDDELREMLRNSRWRINLLLSQGKANYELGQVTSSLHCYARAWRAFLELADTEGRARANFAVVDALVAWLADVEREADLDKVELELRFAQLVQQFETVHSPAHLHVLAAEIMMRIGHVLFILRLPRLEGHTPRRTEKRLGGHPYADHDLAYRCLLQAAWLDHAGTLIAADLLKIEQWSEDQDVAQIDGGDGRRRRRRRREIEPIAAQWPGGSGRFEEAARVVEYVLQQWLGQQQENRGTADEGELIARQLLRSFLTHTDSSNVKLAQVFRYMMRRSADDAASPDPSADDEPALELICLRRYSSFFPFLPRPSSFRVLGGGYFVRVPEPTADSGWFGVAIDPGPHFIDNLYRCGYSLGDVHMIVVTHDHADHIAALDALLALLGYRGLYGVKTFGRDRKLVIVGNESVARRYGFFNETVVDAEGRRRARPDNVRVMTFAQWEARRSTRGLMACGSLTLEPVETVAHRDAAWNVAQGFLLSAGKGAARTSILFTSDTGHAPSIEIDGRVKRRLVRPAQKPLSQALEEADVVVAHVSSIPLRELREHAGLDQPPDGALPDLEHFQALWAELQGQLDPADREAWAERRRFLLRQLQFGFHSRPPKELFESPSEGLEVSPLSPIAEIREPSERHLYLDGLLPIARRMQRLDDRRRLLLIGELREELSTFRTRIASALNDHVFNRRGSETDPAAVALTTDIGLKVRLSPGRTEVLCATCALDNDLVDRERFHAPATIREVCVKGEDEGVFHNCPVHDPQLQARPLWVERVERYDPFGP